MKKTIKDGPFADHGRLTPVPTRDVHRRVVTDPMTRTILRWAQATTPAELAERGVKSLRTVPMSKVAALVEKAVNRALIERTLGRSEGQDGALALSASATGHFVALARAARKGGGAAEPGDELRTEATSVLERLRRELDDRRRKLALDEDGESEGPSDDDAADHALVGKIKELFAEHLGGDDRALETDVLDVVLTEMRSVRARARRAERAIHERELAVLERRIEKLSALLGETEDELRRLHRAQAGDAGVASVHTEVQGISPADGQRAEKAELMRTLFEANMAMRGVPAGSLAAS